MSDSYVNELELEQFYKQVREAFSNIEKDDGLRGNPGEKEGARDGHTGSVGAIFPPLHEVSEESEEPENLGEGEKSEVSSESEESEVSEKSEEPEVSEESEEEDDIFEKSELSEESVEEDDIFE